MSCFKAVFVTLFTLIAALLTLSNLTYGESTSKITITGTDTLGIQLRREIDERYNCLVKTDAFRSGFLQENDVSDVISKFVPVGISFDKAEEILRQAGFQIFVPQSVIITGNRPDRFDVTASIDPYKNVFPGKVSLYVFLSPEKPGDFDKVIRISASFVASYP